jgi:hypothetical protein
MRTEVVPDGDVVVHLSRTEAEECRAVWETSLDEAGRLDPEALVEHLRAAGSPAHLDALPAIVHAALA